MRTNQWILLVALAVGPLSGCGSTPPDVSLNVAGATFPAELYESWAETYRRKFPTVDVTYDSVGSSEGINRFLAESVDIGASDAALTDEQIAKVKRGALLIPATAGSLTVAYNPEGMPVESLKLSREVYADIFLGKITNWSDARIAQLNPGVKLPNLPVTIIVRSDGSGTTFAFTNHLSAISPEWKNGPGVGRSVKWPKADHNAPGNDKVAREVQLKPGAVSYLEYGVASRAKLGMATLQNKAGDYVMPTGHSGLETLLHAELPENLRAFFPDPVGQDAYPIVTFTWLLVYQKYESAEKADAVRKYLRWCLTEGQSQNEGLGFIRLSPQVAKASLAAVEKVKP